MSAPAAMEHWLAPPPTELCNPAQIEHFSGDAPLDEISAVLERDGSVIVEGVLGRDALDSLATETKPLLAASEESNEVLTPEVEVYKGPNLRIVHNAVAKCPTVGQLAVHPVLLGVCDRVLLPNCGSYQLDLTTVLDRGAPDPAQPLHRDDALWSYVTRARAFEVLVTSMTALVDFTLENGATLVVPGSHRWPAERRPTPEEIAVASMPAGSTVFFLGSVIHGGGANTQPEERRAGLVLSYLLGWLRAEECMPLSVPPALAREMPTRLQQLLGYDMHVGGDGSYLGSVEGQSPLALLEEGRLR